MPDLSEMREGIADKKRGNYGASTPDFSEMLKGIADKKGYQGRRDAQAGTEYYYNFHNGEQSWLTKYDGSRVLRSGEKNFLKRAVRALRGTHATMDDFKTPTQSPTGSLVLST